MLALVLLGSCVSLYTGLVVRRELGAARKSLGEAGTDLSGRDLTGARSHLRAGLSALEGWPGRAVRVLPVLRQSSLAVAAATRAGISVVDGAISLQAAASAIEQRGLLRSGRLPVRALGRLQAPLEAEAAHLKVLADTSREQLGGWLLPPVWDALADLSVRSADAARATGSLAGLLGSSDRLAGIGAPRTYLVLLINNAELRGAGGVLTGIGTIRVKGGRVRLGRFHPHTALIRRPYSAVRAPPGYARRYGRYKANTTLWVNATFSPHVPDVAVVAARLYRAVAGVRTDGVLVADPRGLAAIVPRGVRVRPAVGGRSLRADDLPGYVYSGSYVKGLDPEARRTALLALGRAAFSAALATGGGGATTLSGAAESFAGGHLRFVSFHPAEQRVLDRLGVTGSVAAGGFRDVTRVVSQNFGGGGQRGSKLDYWTGRDVSHECTVAEDGAARCTTTAVFTNRAPRGLTRYVAGRPYGLLRSYVEMYVPEDASVRRVLLDRNKAKVRAGREKGQRTIGVYMEVQRRSSERFSVTYDLPAGRSPAYSLLAAPQPLANDARLRVHLRLPAGWSVRGPGDSEGEWFVFDGTWDRTHRFIARPVDKPGLPGLWSAIRRAWRSIF